MSRATDEALRLADVVCTHTDPNLETGACAPCLLVCSRAITDSYMQAQAFDGTSSLPPPPPGRRKGRELDATLSVRFSSRELEQWRLLSQSLGRSPSALLRDTALQVLYGSPP